MASRQSSNDLGTTMRRWVYNSFSFLVYFISHLPHIWNAFQPRPSAESPVHVNQMSIRHTYMSCTTHFNQTEHLCVLSTQ